ncbi:unnamed protein product [Rotaria sp. Silwood1]|nr:unnamed protein product [Rotaria sp. Silwood1]
MIRNLPIRSFGRPANQLMFRHDENDEAPAASAVVSKDISVADYFAKKYRKLMYPHLPCINAMKETQKQPNWLPMKLVRVKRVLAPPEIKYRRRGNGQVIEYVNCGKWRIRNWFYETPEINSWGIIYFGDKLDRFVKNILNEFQNRLANLLERSSFVINTESSSTIKGSLENEINSTLVDVSNQRLQLAIVVLNSYDSNILYNLVKKYANRTLNRSSKDDLFMFFGADVIHSTCSSDRPSVAAVVGSRDMTNSLYAARLCEQLDTMVIDLLRVFGESCDYRLPNKIVFYRDGVDEDQYQKVLDDEVKKIKHACRIVYGNQSLPQLIFIVVKKRHNARFFLYDAKQTMNVQAGTVTDQNIIHPSQFDFYLCSQAAIMGTSRPALYHVLHDDIQQLTYWLCHTDMRCTKSVSIPAPAHYAHLSAYASRALKFGEDRDIESFDENNEELESYSLDDIKTKVMALDEKIADDMWLI